MGSIAPYVRDKVFNPEAIEVMSAAFAKATDFMCGADTATAETLAKHIIAVASQGERDPDKLAAAALAPFFRSK